jgi:hypothetical protein
MENVSVVGLNISQNLEVTEHVAINMVDRKSTGSLTSNCFVEVTRYIAVNKFMWRIVCLTLYLIFVC